MSTAILLIFTATRAGIPLSSSNAIVGGLLGAGVAGYGLSVIILPGPEMVAGVAFYGLLGAGAGAAVLGAVTRALGENVWSGIPVGAVCGAAVTVLFLMVFGVIHLSGLLAVVLFIIISPIFGMVAAFLIDISYVRLFMHSRQDRMKRFYQPLHVLACLLQATAHGGNDGQNSVGLITALLVASGILAGFVIPLWVSLIVALAIGFGTCFGGWKVVDKMAKGITKIRPYQGFCAATASSGTLVMVTLLGIPVSSTHAINGAIVGVGVTRGKNAVQWKAVREMVLAWIITIPLAFTCSYAGYLLLSVILQRVS
jgi:PiT family inorganic phosphate transporter